jgi:DNA-binding winged helix-turn-helix (wHTH) protein
MLLALRVLAFEDFRLNVRTRELVRVGTDGSATPVVLGSRATDLLLLLLSKPGELVTRNQILEAVWPNTTVEDSNLSAQIAALRRALDAGRSGAGCIQTVPGRGYRFTPQVLELIEPEPLLPVAAADTPGPASVDSAPDAGVQWPEQRSSPRTIDAPALPTPRGTERPAKWALLGAGATLVAVAVVAVVWKGVSGGNPCQNGLVPRAAFPNDRVCVTAVVREQTIADNAAAPSRTQANGLCIRGYVWREANPLDHICVTPATRRQTQSDNRAVSPSTAPPVTRGQPGE